MEKFTTKQLKHLEKHTVMENHERGDFIGRIIKIIDDKNNLDLSGVFLINKLLEEYKEHVYNIECGSKKYARKYLRDVFQNKYFDIHPLSIHGFMKDFAKESGKPVISYGTFDKEFALEKLRTIINDEV